MSAAAGDTVKDLWLKAAVNMKPVDLFIIIGNFTIRYNLINALKFCCFCLKAQKCL